MPRVLSDDDVTRLLADARTFRSRVVVRATPARQDSTWATDRGSEMEATAGDWWVSDGDDRWSVAGDVFEATYELVEGELYHKTATVTAVRLDEAFSVLTLEGQASGSAGDWLVRNPSGECWPVPGEQFLRRYEEV